MLDLVTSSDIAKMLGVSQTYVNRLAQRGELPTPDGRLSGGQRVWFQRSIDEWRRRQVGTAKSRLRKQSVASVIRTPMPMFAAASRMASIQKRGYLKVAVNDEIPGYCFRKSSREEIQGFEVDLAGLLASSIFGTKRNASTPGLMELCPIALADREACAKEGEVDVVLGNYAETPARLQDVDFAGHYLFAPQAGIARRGSVQFNSLEQLEQALIGVVTGTLEGNSLERHLRKPKLVEFDSANECLDALVDGRIDTYWMSSASARAWVKYCAEDLEIPSVRLGGERFGFGIRKGSLDFKEFVDTVVSEAFDTGELDASMKHWLG